MSQGQNTGRGEIGSAAWNDTDFVAAFEACRLPVEAFRHRDHVRLVWLYLQQGTLEETRLRTAAALRAFADSIGKATLYHETITWAYILLIHDRMRAGGPGAAVDSTDTFDAFAARNPELMVWKPSILRRHYREETLASEPARLAFVPAELEPLPAP